MSELRDYCIDAITDRLPGAVFNSNKQGAPHIVNLSLPGRKSEPVVNFLDEKGICVSSGAACKSNYTRGPSVLESLGISRALAESALRISFSPLNTKTEIDALVEALALYCRTNEASYY